ncbi:MAG TPA: ABC transporter substrate-binding protein [Burkholderiales bacterium]|nr:ABC transporter substrate-binding protein [Burkholderiales bacterium]
MEGIRRGWTVAAALAAALACASAQAQDKVRMGLFIASSAMPYFIAAERGYFKAENLDVEGIPLATHPLIIQAMIKGDVDTASNLLSLEGANINTLRPGTANYFSINCQNTKYQLEAFVVSAKNNTIRTLKDLKGQRIMVAPGPGNLFVAKGVLKAIGFEDGRDYTMQEQPMAQHIPGLQSGQFETAYTLEPVVSMLEHRKIARKIESGVIATHMLGRPDACAVLAGGVMSDRFLKERPRVAERFARAWARALKDGNEDPTARNLLSKHMNTAPEIAQTVPLSRYYMVRDLTPAQIADFQKLVDMATEAGLVKTKIDVKTFLKTF